ncbi:VPA1269 family protein [Pseudomonas atacamensis]|uniref:gamma-mobile-trio integrase GmtZ n=1 Tax=Pseudomonas atacamensis TaxID=2565368 RepID=UPI00300EC093
MSNKQGKNNGRQSDLSFSWITSDHGAQWEEWRALMEDWMKLQHQGVNHKLRSLNYLLLRCLRKIPDGHEPARFFQAAREGLLPDVEILAPDVSRVVAVRIQNQVVHFINWLIDEHFSEQNDEGRTIRVVDNPFELASKKGLPYTESVHNPLPYTYIKELREILCPKSFGDFRDWEWAQTASGQDRVDGQSARVPGDWFQVDESFINHDDPDCVWRIRTVTRRVNGLITPVEIHELWSPVRAMTLLMKLHLPLRTYQVRFLDSGEADTWRYEEGNWVINHEHLFKNGSEKNPWSRGVFRRIADKYIGDVMTGLYISTNKTADQNKEEYERGYTIPWQHTQILHWLEKLRNWQEKYNPIDRPTSCKELAAKHFGVAKSDQQKNEMGAMCFLFRDAKAKGADRQKPIPQGTIDMLWYRLLFKLESLVASRGQTLSDSSRLRFVKDYGENYKKIKIATEFPLHSLRVSLLTCLAMDGKVPAAALSKLLAGHSRLLMTLYYIKPTPAMMGQALDEATVKMDAAQAESLRVFLRDADMRQIKGKVAFRDEDSLEAALANRNPIGWEHRHVGICLVGGNTARSDEMGTVAGCWNGGDLINVGGGIYGPVPNGPENCTRCRWLATDARFLDALRAQFNNHSYKASMAANLAIELEHVRDDLLDARYRATEEGRPFMQQHELQNAERRYEKQIVLADQYAKDMIATFQLIARIVSIEEGRVDGDDSTKLVAVGSMQDIHQPISLIETTSELLQLSQICEDAEVYPDLADDLRKTPALEKRSRALNKILMRNGYAPLFMQMDERMQIIAGNAMMRMMARKASPTDQLGGFTYISGVIEAGQHMKLLPEGIKALEQVYQGPVVKLADLIASSANSSLEVRP